MAKRFRDTGLWDRPWFRKLPLEQKLAWDYLINADDVIFGGKIWLLDA